MVFFFILFFIDYTPRAPTWILCLKPLKSNGVDSLIKFETWCLVYSFECGQHQARGKTFLSTAWLGPHSLIISPSYVSISYTEKERKWITCMTKKHTLNQCIVILLAGMNKYANTVEPVLKDHSIGHKNVILQNRWSWWQVQLHWNVELSARSMWSFKTGGLMPVVSQDWQWSLKTGFTEKLCVHVLKQLCQ